MNESPSAQEAVCRLLAASWEPQRLPAADSIPWPQVLALAGLGNVIPFLHFAAQPIRDEVPADARQLLEQEFYRAAASGTRVLHQLAGLRRDLADAGAPLLLLKGAALAETLYVDPALRMIGDIDLAILPETMPACRKILLELGYSPLRAEHHPGSRLAHNNQEQFSPPDRFQAPVELHWHLLDVPYYMRRVPMEWFWANSEPLTIAGESFQVLNPEANLLYLPAHLALHHQFRGVHSLLDLALLVVKEQERIDWMKVFAAAQSFELLSALRETLDRLAACWPSLPLDNPRRQAAALKPSRTDERLFRLLSAESRSTTLDFYTTLVSLPDAAARARYAWFNLFPQPEYMKWRYQFEGSWQLPYWYLRRLAGGLPRLARTLPGARRIERG